MELNKIYNGFKLIELKDLADINSTGMIFEHEKTGAKLFFLKNDDDNKVFSISFRTPVSNSTGTPHILEHSVLCGSKKYPVKEPFVELIKGSLNTFLNAMTFPDKTMYPVASKNDKDFLNLMNVYLDAVFYPEIYNHKEIFMQEGWHYELTNKDDDLSYKGVVYNEMKGAFSSPDSVLLRKIQESLFPDTTYGFESGGDPEDIPKLSYEDFIGFHKKFYHPSNSYIYLYGNMDIEDKLKFISENYLNNFNRENINSEIETQKPFENTIEKTFKYPISKNEDENDKTFLSYNFVIGKSTNAEECLALDILEDILLENESSPLKKALINANLGKDVYGFFDKSLLQPIFSIIVKNSNENQKEKFKSVVLNTLNDLVKNGIDKKIIEACINRKEFQLREANYQGLPKGLAYGIQCMDSWLYNSTPFTHLEFTNSLNNIKTALETNYFENLIKKCILSNTHSSILSIVPEKGLTEKKDIETKEFLKKFKSSLSNEDLNSIITETQKLIKRQSTPDSEESLKCIPLISIDDIKKEADKLPLVEKSENDVKVLFHPIFTSGIGYLTMYFDINTLNKDLIPYASLLATLLTNISTKNYNYEDLTNEININTGELNFNAICYSKIDDTSIFYPKFNISSKVLMDKLPKLCGLLKEIILNTKFDEKNKILEIVQKIKSRVEMSMLDRGHLVAAKRLSSYFSITSKYNELLSGIDFYKFLCSIEKDFDLKWTEIKSNLEKTYSTIFNKNNLIVGFTCEEKDYNKFKQNLCPLFNNINTKEFSTEKPKIELTSKNEGFMTSAKIQYVAKGANFNQLNYNFSGALKVLKTIICYDYLWNNIRVKGGAYGCFCHFEMSGNTFFASYRDPNLENTLNVYDNMYDYIKNINLTDREMLKYVIGSISELDTPLTPELKGEFSSVNYIRGLNQDAIQKERNEILNCSSETLNNFATMINDICKQNYICVIGNESKILENKDKFNTTTNLFE